jgi:hypothetical protein
MEESNIHQLFDTTQQLLTSHHEVQIGVMSDQNSNCIPIIVNGQINPTKKDNNNNNNYDDDDNSNNNNNNNNSGSMGMGEVVPL